MYYKKVGIPCYRNKSLKSITSLACGLLIFFCLSLIVFPEARVLAYNAIKTIFVIGNNGKVVEVGQDINLLNNGFSVPTNLSDSEIEKKVGFKITIPKKLSDGFGLESKLLMLFLENDISYETNARISSICQRAILDDSEFAKLKEYKPTRCAGGVYSSKEGDIVLVLNKATQRYYDALENLEKSKSNYQKVKIGDIEGVWIKEKRLVYPNGDMTKKPINIINTYDMAWVSDDLFYFMSSSCNMQTNRCNISHEMGVRIAKAFMDGQKN